MTNLSKRWGGFTILILAMGTVWAQDAHKVAGPSLSPKPYRIGIAPSHITQATAPLFKERAADWDEVRRSIDFYKVYSLQPTPPDWATRLDVDSFAAFAKKHEMAVDAEFGNFKCPGTVGEGEAALRVLEPLVGQKARPQRNPLS